MPENEMPLKKVSRILETVCYIRRGIGSGMLRGIRETVARALHGRSSETVIENETASSLFAQHSVPYNRRSSRSVAVHFHRFAPRNAAVNTLERLS